MAEIYCRSEETPWNVVDDEAVLLNLESGHYFSLNETARFVWERCDGKHNLEDILSELCRQFEVTRKQAAADIEKLTKELLEEGLLVRQEA
ncbi:MAG: PqqD family protein [bacterium]